ncbi:MAG: hypothetical protein KF865_06410 [Bdellovibrionaceae bacterium]|nr:hypothetical protein [Pseudobdellovibrionaceae bacterium]
MTNDPMQPGMEKEVLRVALDKQAAQDFAQMANRLRAENPHVRVQPSAFVSFLVSDFFATYFEKDLGVLVAEFFDSKSYHEAQLQEAKAQGDFEKVMTESLATIRKIKARARRKSGQKRKAKPSPNPASAE